MSGWAATGSRNGAACAGVPGHWEREGNRHVWREGNWDRDGDGDVDGRDRFLKKHDRDGDGDVDRRDKFLKKHDRDGDGDVDRNDRGRGRGRGHGNDRAALPRPAALARSAERLSTTSVKSLRSSFMEPNDGENVCTWTVRWAGKNRIRRR